MRHSTATTAAESYTDGHGHSDCHGHSHCNRNSQCNRNSYGNCTPITTKSSDGHILEQTTYQYDAYRRCTVMLESAHTTQSRKWNWYYDRYFDGVGMIDASAHTSKQWRVQVEPAYDSSNNR